MDKKTKKTTKTTKTKRDNGWATLPLESMSKMGEEGKKVALLANQYFDGVKNKKEQLSAEQLAKELSFIPSQIEELKQLGQTGLAKKLELDLLNIAKERIALANGFNTFVRVGDVLQFINLVDSKVVKLADISMFPRLIPDAPKKIYKKAKDLKIFDKFFILYVDYNEETAKVTTAEQKEIRKRNRDPIIFGSFTRIEKRDDDKLFFICDWEDEFCDVTLSKMVSTLAKQNKQYKPETIIKDSEKYLNNLIRSYEKEEKKTKSKKQEKSTISLSYKEEKKPTLFDKIKKWFK